ncbi:hypothetical protein NQ317_014198 [Molorchus minor]|uniref:Uncharacterized protein n=1 Tax=Molorchus minor TaxID=1323400 RepID=A0ABQ9JD16_9CUCU|nr:hypothetical protein NQ317_014198 [Molorchus minor]
MLRPKENNLMSNVNNHYSETLDVVASASGLNIKREMGTMCLCKNKCRQKLKDSHETIYRKFWELGSLDLQNSYLFACIEIVAKKRSYKNKQKRQESSRKFTVQYMLNVNGEAVKVCKVEFMNIHGLQKSRGRMNNIVKMKATGAVVPISDGRGRH